MDLKIFKIDKKFKKREHQPNPDFYWKIILFITSVFIILALGFGLHLFFVVNQENFYSSTEYKGQAQKINESRINDVLNYFSRRADKSKEILNSPAPVSDPSI